MKISEVVAALIVGEIAPDELENVAREFINFKRFAVAHNVELKGFQPLTDAGLRMQILKEHPGESQHTGNNFISWIKLCRQISGRSLSDAKSWVETRMPL
jgi:hypothetical protein